ncbi:hypothetical protein [Pseudolysinimonas sp.]
MSQIVEFHWRLIAEPAVTARTTVVVPIYPLVRRGTAAEVIPAVADLAADSPAELVLSRRR